MYMLVWITCSLIQWHLSLFKMFRTLKYSYLFHRSYYCSAFYVVHTCMLLSRITLSMLLWCLFFISSYSLAHSFIWEEFECTLSLTPKHVLGLWRNWKDLTRRSILINEHKAQDLGGKCWGHFALNMLKVIDTKFTLLWEIKRGFRCFWISVRGAQRMTAAHKSYILNLAK